MWKVDSKRVISDIAKTTYKSNKKRNIVTITAIFLTTFLLCTVISIGLSYWDTVSLRQQRMNGMDYDIELTEPREEQVSAIRDMDEVAYAGLCVKCSIGSRYGNRELDKIKFFWADTICWEKQVIPALESYSGYYPQKENEIMLSKSALRAMGIERPAAGMKLPITCENLAEGFKNDETEKEFELSGWFLDYTGESKGYVSEDFYKSTGVRQTDLTQGSLKISLKNPLYSEADIIQMQNAVKLAGNQIIEADYDTISNFCKTIAALCMMLVLVFFSGYLFIYNTLYISVNKEIRYYGQLKTLGTTSVQLKKIIYKQVIWNSIIGIGLGLLLSAMIGKGVIPLVLQSVNPTIDKYDGGDASIWVFITAAVFAAVTTFIGSKKPVKIAENFSPADAMRYIGVSEKIKQRNTRGGDIASMARQYLFREKKQFIIILLSLSLAVSLFEVINVVISANNAKNILNHTCDYDIRVLNLTLLSDREEQVITKGLLKKIEKTDGVKDVRVLTSATAIVPYQEDIYGDYYRELYNSRYTPGNYEKDMELYKIQPDYYSFTCRIVGIDSKEFDKINQSLDKQEFENGKIAFVSKTFTAGSNGIPGKAVRFSIPTSVQPKKEEQIKIGEVLDTFPAHYSAGYTPDIIVSHKYLEKLMGEKLLIEMIKIDYDESFSQDTETAILGLLKDNPKLSAESKLQRYADMKNTENQIIILGGSVGLIIMLLSLLNFANMMSASIQNRSKEFAILEGIGMTRKQIRYMITLESLYYAGLAIIISLLIGLPASYFVFNSFNRYGIPFSFPAVRNLVLFAAIILVCVFTALCILDKSKNETIIELLRKEDN